MLSLRAFVGLYPTHVHIHALFPSFSVLSSIPPSVVLFDAANIDTIAFCLFHFSSRLVKLCEALLYNILHTLDSDSAV